MRERVTREFVGVHTRVLAYSLAFYLQVADPALTCNSRVHVTKTCVAFQKVEECRESERSLKTKSFSRAREARENV